MGNVLPSTEKVVIELGLVLNSVDRIFAYLTRDTGGPGEQEFHVLCLNEQGLLLHHWRLMDSGDDERTYRCLLSAVLAVKGTKAFVLAHRHQTRSPVATAAERELRTHLRRALLDAGIRCQDHIIFGPMSYWSFEKGRTARYDCAPRATRTQEERSSPS